MNKNRKVLCIVILVASIVCAVLAVFLHLKKEKTTNLPISNNIPKEVKSTVNKSPVITQTVQKNIVKKINLYKDISDNSLSLDAIYELSQLPENIKQYVKSILDNSNSVYFLKHHGDKVVIISENPDDNTQGILLKEFDINSTSIDQQEKQIIKDSEEDWEFEENEENKRPIKHIKYNQDGSILYTESWNYSPDAEIKYEKKDENGHPISIKKEVINSEGGMLQEHIFYDKDGKIETNVSVTYDGPNLIRFTYFDANNIDTSASIFSEYSDGQKTKETVFSSELKLQKIYIPEVKNGERNNITIYDNQNKEIDKLYSE